MPRWYVDRRCKRFNITVPVLCRLSSDSEGQTHTPMNGFTNNLSELGALVALPERIPPGTQIEVEFSFPQFGAITVDAIIVWAKEPPQGDSSLPHGLRFLRPEMALRVLALTQSPSPAETQKAPVQGDQGQKGNTLQRMAVGKLMSAESGPVPVKAKGHEVLIKFRRKEWQAIRTLLESAFEDINLTETKDEEILLAYCKFYGDLRTLNRKLEELRQSAMVMLGDPQEATFINFFVTLQDIVGTQSGHWKRVLPPLTDLAKPQRKYLTILAAATAGLFIVIQMGILSQPSLKPAPSSPPQRFEQGQPSVLQWQPYVEPTYHKDWLAVQAKYRLTDEMMLDLFRLIKRIDAYSPGHSLADLTPYPQAIDRAFGLLILKGVPDVEGLQTFLQTLEGYFARGNPFPDEPESLTAARYGALATLDKTFAQRIILAFYEQLFRANKAFTEQLLQDLHRRPSADQRQK